MSRTQITKQAVAILSLISSNVLQHTALNDTTRTFVNQTYAFLETLNFCIVLPSAISYVFLRTTDTLSLATLVGKLIILYSKQQVRSYREFLKLLNIFKIKIYQR